MSTDVLNALTGFFPWILPECVLGLFACVLFLGSTWKADRHFWGAFALIGVAIAGVVLLLTPRPQFDTVAKAEAALLASPVWLDSLALYVKLLALVGVGILILFSWDDVSDELAGEYHGCLLFIAAGVCLTGAANELITLFLALELISIPTYILLYLTRSGDAAQEAGVKYFLLSIFSSAMLLFGFSYLYGLTGTTNLAGIASAFPKSSDSNVTDPVKSGLALVAVVMIVAGLGFKITAVPFHFYAPDVYQGTSLGAAALLAYVPKVAGFVALVRVFSLVSFRIGDAPGGGPVNSGHLATLLWIVAAVTMTLGNLLALLQNNLKRLLAYSSVAHSGYMLVGLAAAPYLNGRGVDTVLFYLVAYGAMTVGVFAVLEYLSTKQRPVEMVDDLAGLGKSHPVVALVMMLFLLSLIGIPPTPGFSGKLQLLFDAFSLEQNSERWDAALRTNYLHQAYLFRILALIMVINAAIGSWYYLRIITVMYLRTPLQPLPKPKPSPRLIAVGLCAFLTLVFFYPTPLFNRARAAIDGTVNVTAPAGESGK